MTFDSTILANFGRHTPRILRKQLLQQLVEQYPKSNVDGDVAEVVNGAPNLINECQPSIQRFHGALLFVDISGFTALSLRLSVEELKNHINEYFTKMLDIVDRHGGDVIKFAGDALFIIWETGVSPQPTIPANNSQTASWTNLFQNFTNRKGLSSHNSFSQEMDKMQLTDENNMPTAAEDGPPAPILRQRSRSNDTFDNANSKSVKIIAPVVSKTKMLVTLGNSLKKANLRVSNQSSFALASKLALGKAAECGRDISAICGNHKVSLTQKSNDKTHTSNKGSASPSMFRMVLPSLSGMLSPPRGGGGTVPFSEDIKSPTGSGKEETVAYLNVHSGVSMGLMAGIDIGANDRWEYFLIGDPLSDVATAESLASSGDVVISPEAHAVLHPTTSQPGSSSSVPVQSSSGSSNSAAPPTIQLSDTMHCGCVKLESGFCRLSAKDSPKAKLQKSRIKAKVDDSLSMDDTYSKDSSMLEDIAQDVLDAFDAHGFLIRTEIYKRVMAKDNEGEGISGDLQTRLQNLNEDCINRHFGKWAQNCLSDDLARHVHDVARDDYIFIEMNRSEPLKKEVDYQLQRSVEHISKTKLQFSASAPALPGVVPVESSDKSVSITYPSILTRHMTSSKAVLPARAGAAPALAPLKRRQSSKRMHIKDNQQDTGAMLAEIRQVTVMFVKIDMPDMELLVDRNRSRVKTTGGEGKFLARTVNEKYADDLLLNRLQSCMAALTTAFSDNGGQMRQFIVDDKGTVCIGTFGLRGSVSDDNAASAIETAKLIIKKLQGLGIDSSIGVTVGRAYCGLVGSSKRHEYAVMGPSTNLSARLMCKAPPRGILCDSEIRTRDRMHTFQTLAHIVAKGYKDPVGTFMPNMSSESISTAAASTAFAQTTESSVTSGVVKLMRRETGSNGLLSNGGDGSNLDLGNDRGSRFLRKLLRSNYYLKPPNNAVKSTASLKNSGSFNTKPRLQLRGRQTELENIALFLFETIVNHGEPIAEAREDSNIKPSLRKLKDVATKVVESVRFTLFVTEPARFVGITSAQGMGRTALVTAITLQLFTVANIDKHLNIHMFKTRSSALQVGLSLGPWRTIIREILILTSKVTLFPGAASKSHKKSLITGSTTNNKDVVLGAEHIASQLPDRLQELMPLLGELESLLEDTEAVDALQLGKIEKVNKTIELLVGIIQAFVTVTNKLVFITVEDVHTFDPASLTMLHQLWLHNTGVIVLFTGRTHQIMGQHRHNSVVTPTRRRSVDVRMVSSEAHKDVLEDFTKLFQSDADRFFTVKLERLENAAVAEVVTDLFNGQDMPQEAYELVNQICDVSSGNPTYATELSKTIIEQGHDAFDTDALIKIVSSFRINRIGEVICHRFDQLNTVAQTVLKMAAVACSNGAPFTIDLLLFVFDNDSNEKMIGLSSSHSRSGKISEDLSIYSVLFEILQSENFIRVVPEGRHHLTISRENISSGGFRFEFNVPLEQRTIYDLLLDDQKQVIHECVAEYYQHSADSRSRRLEMDPAIKAEALWEEAFHWQHGAGWANAMKCAYKASQLHPDKQKQHVYLQTAHTYYTALVEHALEHADMLLESSEDRESTKLKMMDHNGQMSFASLVVQFNNAFGAAPGKTALVDRSSWSLQKIFHIFEGDSDSLDIGLRIHIQMAHKCMAFLDDSDSTHQILEHAIQILLHTKNPVLMSNTRLANMKNSNYHSLCAKTVDMGDDEDNHRREDYFCPEDFEGVCFPLVSAYVQNYLYSHSEDEDTREKVVFIATQYFELTKEDVDSLHHLQAGLLFTQLNHKIGKVAEAIAMLDEVLIVKYSEHTHSAQLIETYGSDQMPVVLALISQTLFLSGKWQHGIELIVFAHDLTLTIGHAATVAMATFRVVSTLTFLRRYDEAVAVFAHYLMTKEQENLQHSQTVDRVNEIYLEWLSRLVKYEIYLKSGDAQLFESDSLEVDSILQGGVPQFAGATGRVLLYDLLALQGRGIDSVFADMCRMKIAVMNNQQALDSWNQMSFNDQETYCDASIGFVKHSLDVQCGAPHRLAFTHLNTITSLAQTVRVITNSAEKSAKIVSQFKEELSTTCAVLVALESQFCADTHLFGSYMMALLRRQSGGDAINDARVTEIEQQLEQLNSGTEGYTELRRLVLEQLPNLLPSKK